MSIVKRYLFYKRAFFICNVLNVFFIIMGAVAFVHYAKNQEISALEMVIVGVGVLLFGILIPFFLFHQLKQAALDLRKDTEKTVAQWIAGWIDTYRSGADEDTEPTREPYFWLNIILMTVELFGEKSKHPVAKIVGEFAPLLKAELHKSAKTSSKKTPVDPKPPTPRRTRKPRETA